MPNALAREKSPYLRQHADNPVDWLPWGEEAFAKARTEDKPIFLSVGYSTCHWCHVMAHESFEDANVAAILNRDFVPVKVDREERPDVDRIYMLFVQASTGSGGWPMSVWLTPSLRPFFGGTYFPPDSRYGRPGFATLLQHLARAWREERERIESSSIDVTDQLRAMSGSSAVHEEANRPLFESAFWQFRRSFDARWGGFGSAPKFPRPVVFNYLLRFYKFSGNEEAVEMTVQTLEAMAQGGMHDHLGGGFHRYSVDERWFVPHFEKMLYDQAQLAFSYLEAFQVTGQERLADTARNIFTYVLRDMTDEPGGFYSAEDADSPDPDHSGHNREGAFYVWTQGEIEGVLDEAAAGAFCRHYGVQPGGNVEQDPHGEFTGRNILYETVDPDPALLPAKTTLFHVREKRPRPHLDDKVLTSWNALMISALVKGYVVLDHATYLEAAERSADFVLSKLYEGGELKRRYCEGEAAIEGFLDDYAFFAQALLDLFEATGKAEYLRTAASLAMRVLDLFEDKQHGGFFSSAAGAADLVLRVKDDYDGAEPSGNSVATGVLLRLAHVTGNDEFRGSAERSIRSFAPKLKAQPTMAPEMLAAIGRLLTEPHQTIVRCAAIDDEVEQLLSQTRKEFDPYAIAVAITDEAAAALQSVAPFVAALERKGRITVYECHNFTCDLPRVID